MSHAVKAGLVLLSLYFLALAGPVFAQEPPDLEFNPVTGFLESVDVTGDASHVVRHVVDQGQGRTRTVTLVSPAVGQRPRIAIQPDGDSWVVWSAGTTPDRLYYAKRTLATTTWSPGVALSAASDDSRNPEIVRHGGAVWIAYEIRTDVARTVVATGVIDTPEPVPTVVPIKTVNYTGDLDIMLHSETGHLWTTWIDSATQVGWSERNAATGNWSLPQYQPLALIGVTAAREVIRAIVAGL